MASFVARQALGSFRRSRVNYVRCAQRTIHLTPVVQKKKARVELDNLFDDADNMEELIKDTPAQGAPVASTSALDAADAASETEVATEAAPGITRKSSRLSPEKRLKRFEDIIAFIEPRIGRRPAEKLPPVRNSAWVNLVMLATSEEQLKRVVEMFPKWRDGGRELDADLSELFIRRCEELSCPLLALDVFGNYSKYNLKLTLPGARQLLHSLHVEYPIEKVTLASALFSIYNLPPLSEDLVCCSLFVSALYKHNSVHSRTIADALVPHLQNILENHKPLKVSDVPLEKAQQKPDVWVKWALKKIDKALFVRDQKRASWLTAWRMRSGHIAKPTAEI